jgi:repressor LexA
MGVMDSGALVVPQPLTATQTRIVKYIAAFARQNGFPPTVREIGAAVGLASSSTVAYQLKRLEKLGVLRHTQGVARGTVVVNGESLLRGER